MDDSVTITTGKTHFNVNFERLFIEKKTNMLRTAYTILGNKEDAQDALQEAYCTAYTHILKLKNPNYFYTWVYRILINSCNKILKKNRRTVEFKELCNFKYHQIADEIETKILIIDILKKLSSEHRKVIVLKCIEGFTLHEISEILNIPIGTVKSRYFYAIEKVRQYYLQEDNKNEL